MPTITAWEYKVIKFGTVFDNDVFKKVEPALNILGKEGWEAVTLNFLPALGTVLLKRPVPPSESAM